MRKIATEQIKDCEFCKRPVSKYLHIVEHVDPRIFVTIESHGYLKIFDEDMPGFCDEVRINYCPICGRELRSESRRIANITNSQVTEDLVNDNDDVINQDAKSGETDGGYFLIGEEAGKREVIEPSEPLEEIKEVEEVKVEVEDEQKEKAESSVEEISEGREIIAKNAEKASYIRNKVRGRKRKRNAAPKMSARARERAAIRKMYE